MVRLPGAVIGAVLLALLLMRAVAAEVVTATPADGSQFETFTFVGSGFVPGDLVSVSLTSPDNEELRLYDANDQELLLAVDADGGFSLTLRPVDDLAGSASGVWTARFCPGIGLYCQQVAFVVRLAR